MHPAAAAAPAPTEATIVLSPEEQARLEAEQAEIEAQLEEERLKKMRVALQEMGATFVKEFDEAKTHRRDIEERWVEDLRQYKGLYDPKTQTKLNASERSKLNLRLTRAKVRSLVARLSDMLFPAGDKNWSISATPNPELDPTLYQAEIALISQRDGGVDKTAIKKAIDEIAKTRAEKMSKEIDDQLVEGDYEAECRKVIASGSIFGTGILKGPLGSPAQVRRWRRRADGTWGMEVVTERKPYFGFVPVWNYYPDPTQTDRRFCRYEFEYKPSTYTDICKLKDNSAFLPDQVDMVLKQFPNGNIMQMEQWEVDLRQISKDQTNKPNPTNLFRLLERWGYVKGKHLKPFMPDMEFEDEREYEAQVWMVQDIIVRIDINPFESESRPFKLFYLDKDESSIWGEGVPSIMRDPARAANTAVRALVDNAAISALPIAEVNLDLMDEEEDTDSITAGRIFKRRGRGLESQYDAVRFKDVPNHTEQFMALLKLFIDMSDEITTLPRYTYGNNDGAEVSKTVGGLSMLMGQSNITLKDLAKSWDCGITEPFIGDMYAWNMQFNENDEIKGDYDVNARGASSLVAKEIRSNALAAFTADIIKMAPGAAKIRELFVERARNMDLDPDLFIKSQEQMDEDDQEKQMANAAMQTVAAISKAMGVAPEALVQNIDAVIQQIVALRKSAQATAAVAQ